MDVHEDTNKNLVTATFELPGLKKEDVQIDAHNNRLTIQAESKISEEHDQGGWAVRERHFGKFTRAMQLPSGVAVNQSVLYVFQDLTSSAYFRRIKSRPAWIMEF